MKKLYGDGIHDDTEAIQEQIDSAVNELRLPQPKVCYIISKPLEIPSNFRLVLPRFAEIKLADHSNCVMVKNQTADKIKYTHQNSIWSYANQYDPGHVSNNIEICGGIWNCNNTGQNPNPGETGIYEPAGYSGFGMLFFSVHNFTIRSLTIKDPVTFGINFDRISYFTVEDIVFDYNYGNPCAVNMDGIHLNGNCHFGIIRNLKGTCYDDMVALNADEGSDGDITNIEVSGLWAENCHSAVRLLTVRNKLENIHIHDIYGTYYQYCVGISKYYKGECTGYYAGISIDHVYASKAERKSIYCKDGMYVFPLIWMEAELVIHDLSISDIRRRETNTPVETIHVGAHTLIEQFNISRVFIENETKDPIPLLVNFGNIKNLSLGIVKTGTDKPLVVNNGEIKHQKNL